MATYSYLDTMVSISGPNGSFSLGAGSGNTEGGVTITMTEDKNTMTVGADGTVMHSLHAGKSGTITVRLLKTSPTNALLSEMYGLDIVNCRSHGYNTISIRDMCRNDVIVAQQCAFAKFAEITFAKDGGEMVWTFHVGVIDFKLGSGTATPLGIAA